MRRRDLLKGLVGLPFAAAMCSSAASAFNDLSALSLDVPETDGPIVEGVIIKHPWGIVGSTTVVTDGWSGETKVIEYLWVCAVAQTARPDEWYIHQKTLPVGEKPVVYPISRDVTKGDKIEMEYV